MRGVKETVSRREGFTLIELIVVIAIILAIAALAAAFAPRVSNSTNLSRAIDQTEQWLLTAKMRAKRDGLATGIRFIAMPGDTAGTYSQCQYIQQPDPLSGGMATTSSASAAYPYLVNSSNYYAGGLCVSAAGGTVQFAGVDFTMGGALPVNQYLVQPGDYLVLQDGNPYLIGQVSTSSPTNTLVLGVPNSSNPYVNSPTSTTYDTSLSITTPTTNYRILRQPRILIGEAPLVLPNNFAVDATLIPDTIIPNNSTTTLVPWSNVAAGSSGNLEILFSPTGAVVGTNAGSGKLYLFVHDVTLSATDILNMSGIIAVQCRTGFISAYSVAPGPDPFLFAESGRESGL